MNNPTASQMAKARWAKTTQAQRTAHAKKMVKAREDLKKERRKKVRS